WNEKEHRFEPGEVVWSVGCRLEKDGDCQTLTLEEEKEVPAGDWFLVIPTEGVLVAGQYIAERPLPAKKVIFKLEH
ncbi:unnamed protein product, partial [marine sediment metagenome]